MAARSSTGGGHDGTASGPPPTAQHGTKRTAAEAGKLASLHLCDLSTT
jgi:hypothetical protein